MSVKVKIKLDGKEAKDMAKKATGEDPRVASAFHEVFHDVPKVVKHTARTEGAKQANKQKIAIALSKARAAGAKVPDKSGANYVSSNALHRPDPVTAKMTKGSERVPYKPVPGSRDPIQEVIPDASVGGSGFGPSYFGGYIDTLKPVDRAINPVEETRMTNNACRDARTNLGRGKVGIPIVEEENNVRRSR